MKPKNKTEAAFLRSSMAKADKIYRRDKAELGRRMTAAHMDWAFGLPTRRRQAET